MRLEGVKELSDRISKWLLRFADPEFLENFMPPPEPEHPNENLRQRLERIVREYSPVESEHLRARELYWKYLKKLSQEGHPSGKKFVDFATDEYFDEFITQQGMSPQFVKQVISGPITIFSGVRRSELPDEAEESNLLSPRQIDARRHNERFKNSDSSPKTPSQVSDNAPEKPSSPETTTTERQQLQNQEQEEQSQRQEQMLPPKPEDLYQGWKVGGKAKLQEMLENIPEEYEE
jgi:hypothetical protein